MIDLTPPFLSAAADKLAGGRQETRYAAALILMDFWVIDGAHTKKKVALVETKQGLKRWERPFVVQMIKVE